MIADRPVAPEPAAATAPPGSPALTDLHLRLVAACPLRCRHCYASAWLGRSDRLPGWLVCAAIDDAIGLGLERVTFTGGEPLLHPELTRLIEHCVARGVRARLETSGLLLCRDGSAVRRIIVDSAPMVAVHVSYDLAAQRGLSAADHDRVKALVVDLHERGVEVRLQTTVTEINVHALDELTELPRTLGIRQRIFLDHSALGNGAALAPLALDVVLAAYRELESRRLRLDLELPPLISGQSREGCGWGVHRCEVMPNGDVTACGPITFTHAGFVAGNVRREQLRTLWCDSAYFTALRDLGRRDFPGVCGRCVFWETCRGSCRAYAWSRGGSWVAPYPLCQVFAERYPDQTRDRLLSGGAAEAPR